MTPFEKTLQSSLGEMQGPTPYDAEEIAALRKRAWREMGLLIVSPSDRRLTEADRRALARIAETLYGSGGI